MCLSKVASKESQVKSAANKIQIGGEHYKVLGFEHWDFVVAYDLNYFEGQITKYVARCRKKGGLQDLEKAAHFLQKYMEVYDVMYPLHDDAEPGSGYVDQD
jgi:hypothetical protein